MIDKSHHDSLKKTFLFSSDTMKILITGLIFLVLAAIVRTGIFHEKLTYIVEAFCNPAFTGFSETKWLSGILFIIAGALLICIGIPRIWISTVSGAVFGAALGSFIGLSASLLGATGIYYFSKWFLSSIIHNRFQAKYGRWISKGQENGFWWVMYARLFPFSNSTFLSLICGAVNIPFWPYFTASVLGFIPLAIVFSFFGSGSFQGNYYHILLGFFSIALVFLFRFFVSKLYSGTGQSAKKKGECL